MLVKLICVLCGGSALSEMHDPCAYSYASKRRNALESEQRDTVARRLDQLGLHPCKGRPYMPLLATAVVHKVCRRSPPPGSDTSLCTEALPRCASVAAAPAAMRLSQARVIHLAYRDEATRLYLVSRVLICVCTCVQFCFQSACLFA